jgi:DNA-binding MarR family transcriptional regulator
MGPVANLLAMDRTTLTAALKPLERRGLVRGDPHPTDKRSRILILTDLGRKALALALPVWKSTHEEIENSLRGIDPDQLRKCLKSLS